ncbi:MAG TPA: alpha/beta hydrolase [Hyphomicrobiaceae bacterium]|nr:alpha/beta hydrolase [Hyphomicrobiaceae bacterium]
MNAHTYDLATLSHDSLACTGGTARWRFIWAHGWGQNRKAFAPLAQSFQSLGDHVLLDFPGFGNSPQPRETWTTADYADLCARFLEANPTSAETVWIGHSFGGRVGLQLAARHPKTLARMCLIASAGLPRQRSAIEKARVTGKVYTYKALKKLAPLIGMDTGKLRDRFGSTDYKAAGAMRDILIKTVKEDQTKSAATIRCPVQLIYGERDTETPPEIGRRLAQLIPGAKLHILDGQDHYSVLGEGRHQVAKRLRDFLGEA